MILVCPHCRKPNRVPPERLQAGPSCGQCHRPLFTGQPLEVDATTFERFLQRDETPLLVDFWAPWCGPCRQFAPVFAQAAGRLEPGLRLLKVNTEASPQLASRLAIRSIPTLALFRGGTEVERISGALPAAQLDAWVTRALGPRRA